MKHYLVNGIVASLLLLCLPPSIATAAEVSYGRQLMHGDWSSWHWDFGFAHWGFGIVLWLVIILSIVAIIALVRGSSQK